MSKMVTGKFVSDRGIAELFNREDEAMCEYGAWHWLLANAAYQDHVIHYEGQFLTVKRGQVPVSFRTLANEMGWHLSRAQRFVKKVSKIGLIEPHTDTPFMFITICNYDDLQRFATRTDTPTTTVSSTTSDTFPFTNRTNGTKGTNKKKNEAICSQTENSNPCTDIEPIWKMALKQEFGDAQYNAWIEPLAFENGYIICPNKVTEDWCRSHYTTAMKKALKNEHLELHGFKSLKPPVKS